MKRLKIALVALMMTVGFAFATQPVGAINLFKNCDSKSGGAVCAETTGGKAKVSELTQNIIKLLLFILGVVAVIMIIVGGLRYVLSGGDSTKTASAKNTILYAVVGLVVALLAYAIVGFVLDQFK